jgi:hypothetical protein
MAILTMMEEVVHFALQRLHPEPLLVVEKEAGEGGVRIQEKFNSHLCIHLVESLNLDSQVFADDMFSLLLTLIKCTSFYS